MLLSLRLTRCILNFQYHVNIRFLSKSCKSCLLTINSKVLSPDKVIPKPSLQSFNALGKCCWLIHVKTMAGHSKWQNIRHIKAAKDKEKAILSSQFAQRVRAIIKETGESNPKFNIKLDKIIHDAKKAGIPNSTIQNALKSSSTPVGDYYLEIKCFGPIALIVVITSSTFYQTKGEILSILKKNNMKHEPHCTEGMFEKKGVIYVKPMEGFNLADALDLAIEVNAEDVMEESDEENSPYLKFFCEPKNLSNVSSSLRDIGHNVTYSEQEYLPTTVYPVDDGNMELLEKVLEKLYSVSDVDRIFDNVDR
ncbi:uncharacterized protein LOC115215122 [Argonauta hians]